MGQRRLDVPLIVENVYVRRDVHSHLASLWPQSGMISHFPEEAVDTDPQ